jgi:hypothetical protein
MDISARTSLKQFFRTLFIGIAIGTFSGFFLAKHGTNPFVKHSETSAENPNLKTHPRSAAVTSINGSASAAHPKAPLLIGGATRSTEGADTPVPSGETQHYEAPSPDVIRVISETNIMPGVVQSKEFDEKARETYTTEILPDGSNASRTYREDGSMKSEQVDLPDGSQLERSFFEAGGTKAANYKNPDGSVTSASYDSTGVPSEMMTTFPDRTTIFNEYDDHGKILGVWQHFPDGRTEPYSEDSAPSSNPEAQSE